MSHRALVGLAAGFVCLSGCGSDDSVGFPSATGGAAGGLPTGGVGGAVTGGTGGSVGGTGGAITGGTGGVITGGTGGVITGGSGGVITGGTGGVVTGGTGGVTGGTGGVITGGTGGIVTGGTGGVVTGGTGGVTGGTGGVVTGGTGGVTGGTGGVTGGTGGTGGCTGDSQCTDNNLCTADTCVSGQCTFTTIPLDDQNVCTTDSCDPTTGIKHTPVDASDGDACTLDLCDPTAGVSHAKEILLFDEDFSDNSAGWNLGTEWEIKPATASSGAALGGNDPAADHTATADNGVAGVIVGGFPAKTVHNMYYLMSPAIDLTKAPGGSFVELRFWRWLNADYSPYMRSRIEVWTGSAWTVIWSTQNQNPAEFLIDAPPRGIGWYPMSFDVTSYKNAQFRVRFGFDVGNSQVYTLGGWTVDDVALSALPVATDANQCTSMSCSSSTGAIFTPLPLDDANACTVDTCTTSGGLQHVPKTRIFSESFANNNAGWTVGPDWQIGPAQSSGCGNSSCGGNDPSNDHTGTNDNGVAGVAIGGCTGTSTHGDYCLTSPNVSLATATGSISLGYWRHLHTDGAPDMVSRVDVSANGGTSWTTLWQTGNQCVNDSAWTVQSFDVTAYKSSSFRVRFCSAITAAGGLDGGGFSVDDVALYDPACLQP